MRPLHDGIGAAVILVALVVLLAMKCAGPEPCPGGIRPNHSGVPECHTIDAPTWRPIDPTNGGDIVL